MVNTLDYEGFILDVEIEQDSKYITGRIRKNKYLTFREAPLYDVSAETVRELVEKFENKVDNGLEEYYRKEKELEETNSVVLTYKNLDLRVIKTSSDIFVGTLVGSNMSAPTFKSKDLAKVKVGFERYIDVLLRHVNLYSMMTTYKRDRTKRRRD